MKRIMIMIPSESMLKSFTERRARTAELPLSFILFVPFAAVHSVRARFYSLFVFFSLPVMQTPD